MDMQLWLDLAGLRIGPLTAALDHQRRRTRLLQCGTSRLRIVIAFNADDETFGEVDFTRMISVAEGRNRWTEYDLLLVVRYQRQSHDRPC